MRMMNRQDAKDAKKKEPGEELDRVAHGVIGAAIEVHRALGPGYLESVYEEALCVELRNRSLSFARQVVFEIDYKGVSVGQGRLDFLVADQLVLELKAVEELLPVHHAQVISYLKSTHHPLGLLINFNVPVLKDGIRRIILSNFLFLLILLLGVLASWRFNSGA